MRTVRTKVYQFSELSKEAQKKAIDKMYYVNVDFDWWEQMYEDAAEIGLKITGFDIDRGNFCEGEFNLSANEVAQNILNNHGEMCDTYKTAVKFMEEWQPVFNTYMETEEGEDKLLEIEGDFLNSLCCDYLVMLRNEYEYMTSEAAIIETIEANEYEFTVDGKRF